MGLIVTGEMINDRLLASGKDAKLIGPYQKSKIKSLFECSHGHTWMATPDNVMRRSGCPKCFAIESKIRSEIATHTKEDMNAYLLEEGRGFILIGDYTNNATKTLFQCGLGHRWEAVPRNIKSGRGCPYCADYTQGGFKPGKSAWSYLLDFGYFLKFGITNDLTRRLKDHQKSGTYTVLHTQYHEVGQKAWDWERLIKQTYGGNFVTKDELPDGWTETLSITLAEQIRSTMV